MVLICFVSNCFFIFSSMTCLKRNIVYFVTIWVTLWTCTPDFIVYDNSRVHQSWKNVGEYSTKPWQRRRVKSSSIFHGKFRGRGPRGCARKSKGNTVSYTSFSFIKLPAQPIIYCKYYCCNYHMILILKAALRRIRTAAIHINQIINQPIRH